MVSSFDSVAFGFQKDSHPKASQPAVPKNQFKPDDARETRSTSVPHHHSEFLTSTRVDSDRNKLSTRYEVVIVVSPPSFVGAVLPSGTALVSSQNPDPFVSRTYVW